MKYSFRDFLSLSSAESKGIFVLIVLILLITGIQAYMTFHTPAGERTDDSVFIKEIKEFEKYLSVQAVKDTYSYAAALITEADAESAETFYFDPNTVSAGEMRRLGMNAKLTRTLVNYRLHGGKFYKVEDLKKIYVMPDEVYQRLAPYVLIEKVKGRSFPISEDKTPVLSDINMADSAALVKIYGIGPVLARRIIRYRNLLGGFYNTGQVSEVYGITDSVAMEVNRMFYADTGTIRKINLNHATETDLSRHPYIGNFQAKGIIRYRKLKQRILDIEEIRINGLVAAEGFEKLKKYLTI